MYKIKLLVDEVEVMAPHLHRVLNGLMSGKLQASESRKLEALVFRHYLQHPKTGCGFAVSARTMDEFMGFKKSLCKSELERPLLAATIRFSPW